MKYKLVCADVDGTLVDSKGRIPKENIEAIKRLQDAGVIFAICSGRVYMAANMLAKYYGITGYIVACNGGIVVNNANEEIVQINNISMEKRKRICDIADRYNCVVGLNKKDGIIYRGWDGVENILYGEVNTMYSHKTGLHLGIEQDPDYRKHLSEEELVKFSIWATSEEDFKSLGRDLDQLDGIEKATALKWQFEVTERNVSKWSGVECLMKLYGLKKEEVVCIGDTLNDYAMVSHAGLGIAMGNAMPELKQAAGFVTDTNDNAGLAKAIDLCLEGKL